MTRLNHKWVLTVHVSVTVMQNRCSPSWCRPRDSWWICWQTWGVRAHPRNTTGNWCRGWGVWSLLRTTSPRSSPWSSTPTPSPTYLLGQPLTPWVMEFTQVSNTKIDVLIQASNWMLVIHFEQCLAFLIDCYLTNVYFQPRTVRNLYLCPWTFPSACKLCGKFWTSPSTLVGLYTTAGSCWSCTWQASRTVSLSQSVEAV